MLDLISSLHLPPITTFIFCLVILGNISLLGNCVVNIKNTPAPAPLLAIKANIL